MADHSRRDFLSAAAALAAGLAIDGCSSDGGGSAGPTGASGRTGVPAPGGTGATGTRAPAWKLTDIEHVVIFMQENRTFDQYFGTRPGVRGFADPDVLVQPDGRPLWYQPTDRHADGFILPFHVRSLDSAGQFIPGCDHSWEGMHTAWNGGKMDGFAKVNGALAMPYYRRSDIPYYWALADHFTLCDHFFCSVLGPTLPNRHMSMSGTIDPGGALGGPVVDNDGRGYRWETYPERLQKAGISWRIYHETDDYDDNAVKYYQRFMDATPGDPLYDNAMANLATDAFEQDVASGNLPQVTWIVAPTLLSEHPPYYPSAGEDYTARKLAALFAQPALWAKTAFILTYDESDGAFDHVPPPVPEPGTPDEFLTVGDQDVPAPIGLGMRVPTMVISPFSRATRTPGGRVVSEVYDHTSVLRFLETRFGVEVPNLSSWRREACADLLTAFDVNASPDVTVPSLPDTVAHLDRVSASVRANPLPEVPAPQSMPSLDPPAT